MRLSASRASIDFEYEFINGTVITLKYMEPTTDMIDEISNVNSDQEVMGVAKKQLRKCLKGDDDMIEKLIKEQTEEANIYSFKEQLDTALLESVRGK